MFLDSWPLLHYHSAQKVNPFVLGVTEQPSNAVRGSAELVAVCAENAGTTS